MRFSRSIKSSIHSLPSPNGAYIATILPSKLTLRTTRSLELLRIVTLPLELSANIQWLLWSPSSNRILICATDVVRVFCIINPKFTATISNPTSGTAKITSISFGATDDEICVFSDFGLKVTVYNLLTSTSVEILSPKLYSSRNTSKGHAYRPRSQHSALLTRRDGKDIISIHGRNSYDVLRSWFPDTIDAQSMSWSADGRWLTVVESACHGHKILLYTADGHLFKVWNGPKPTSDEERDIALGAGVRMVDWNLIGDFIAVSDQSMAITVLSAPSLSELLRLRHSYTVKPVTGLEIWQEQIVSTNPGQFERSFALCTQTICPPTTTASPTTNDSNIGVGTDILAFDNSGTLVVTRCEIMPTTIWIWDIALKVLKVVVILHAPVAKVTWHPTSNELLMIRCEGDDSKGLAHLWDPTWKSPKIVDFGTQLPEAKIIGKSIIRWLICDSASPALFFSDAQDCILGVVTEDHDEDLPWQDTAVKVVDIHGQQEESPLNLVEAKIKGPFEVGRNPWLEETVTGMSAGDTLDDTFQFKKFAGS